MIGLQTPLSTINGIGPRFLKSLGKLKLTTVGDLLRHFPARYEDFSKISKIAELQVGQSATIQASVKKIRSRRTWQRRMAITEAIVEDDSGSIKAVWFNQPFVANVLRPGRLANFSGKVSLSDNEIYLSHPLYETLNSKFESLNSKTKHTGRLIPAYPETRGLTSKGIRFLVHPILRNLEKISEWIPREILQKNNLPEINQALNDIHFPEKIEDALRAQKRFSFEDIFLLQLFNLQQKLKLAREKAPIIKTDIAKLKTALDDLPFQLTFSQKRSLWEIIKNIGKPQPMNRLLQGDVGSGKTAVAVLAAAIAAENGYQTAFMAPTEVLARQHYETLKKLFSGFDQKANVGLLTAGAAKIFYENDLETEPKKPELKNKILSGEVKIILGTHALIQKNLQFKNLGIVIIDEQHRFGVRQRAELLKNGGGLIPHFLSMSATPIPRTLTLTLFGDLDLSIIDEMPRGRKPIVTKVVAPENRPKAYSFIHDQVKKGRQVFVICPRIEKQIAKSEEQIVVDKRRMLWDDVKNVTEEYEKLSKKIFSDLKVAMLHGKMKPKEKGEIMRKFKNRESDILVSTSVIEVGVDVSNATIMMIEGAERFGLAQLYQFRGRVGRGKHQSFCFLFTESDSQSTRARLQAIVNAKNGFELAEKDLKLRGPGEFLGSTQSGMPDIAMRALQNPDLIKSSREEAVKILQRDPSLKKYPPLLEKLRGFEKRIHPE